MKQGARVASPYQEEADLKPFPASSVQALELGHSSIGGDVPVKMHPKFTLTFTVGTPMREINDRIIQTVLQYARGNQHRAAQLLQINPRTIRRRLGKKEEGSSASQAA